MDEVRGRRFRDGKASVSEAMQQLGIKPIEIDIKDRLVESLIASRPIEFLIWFMGGRTYCKDFCVPLVSPSQVQELYQLWHLINRELSKFGNRWVYRRHPW